MDPHVDIAPHIRVFRKLWLMLLRVKHRVVFCPSDRSGEDLDLSRWMELLPEDVRKKPLNSLMIPGSHDAGSYGLKTSYGFAPDQSELERVWWFRHFPRVALSISRRWTKTQSADVTQQLLHGVRYFDLRGAPKVYLSESRSNSLNATKLFFVHALYGPSLTKIAGRINDFLEAHAGEFVILHFQHFHAVNQEIESRFLNELIQVFGRKLCPFSARHINSSLEELISKGYQAIIVFPSDSLVTSQKVWPSQYLPNPWANTTDVKTLKDFLQQQIASRASDRLFVTQGVLTPDHSFIRSHLLSSLRKSLAEPCNRFLDVWLDHLMPGTSGPNIIMSDFIDWNDYQLPRKSSAKEL